MIKHCDTGKLNKIEYIVLMVPDGQESLMVVSHGSRYGLSRKMEAYTFQLAQEAGSQMGMVKQYMLKSVLSEVLPPTWTTPLKVT